MQLRRFSHARVKIVNKHDRIELRKVNHFVHKGTRPSVGLGRQRALIHKRTWRAFRLRIDFLWFRASLVEYLDTLLHAVINTVSIQPIFREQ